MVESERSPPVSKRRRSRSPDTREYRHDGGGRSSSRNRSPGYRPPTSRREERGSRGQSSGAERRRDDGYGNRRSGKGGEYSERDREKERSDDRKRYDAAVKKEAGEDGDEEPAPDLAKPNFGNSGLLARETNTVKGVQIKYNEPPEARKPLKNWRLYVFKGTEQIDLVHIYRQSAYLVGRDTVVTDIPVAHPSCSKQHAAIQFRQITEKNEYGETSSSVKPFIIDLDSTNGTHVNDQEIPKSRYYELRNSDVIKFGTSSREYVLLHEDAST